MLLLNQMIITRRLSEFVSELIDIRNEELNDKSLWEFWLHKDHERTFAEFRAEILETPTEFSKEQKIDVVNHSKSMMEDFVPQD